jgi:hypothetical protein
MANGSGCTGFGRVKVQIIHKFGVRKTPFVDESFPEDIIVAIPAVRSTSI